MGLLGGHTAAGWRGARPGRPRRAPPQDAAPASGGQRQRSDERCGKPCGAGCRWASTSASLPVGRPRRERHGRQPDAGKPTVRDDLGGLRTRGQWWNEAPTSPIERACAGTSLP